MMNVHIVRVHREVLALWTLQPSARLVSASLLVGWRPAPACASLTSLLLLRRGLPGALPCLWILRRRLVGCGPLSLDSSRPGSSSGFRAPTGAARGSASSSAAGLRALRLGRQPALRFRTRPKPPPPRPVKSVPC